MTVSENMGENKVGVGGIKSFFLFMRHSSFSLLLIKGKISSQYLPKFCTILIRNCPSPTFLSDEGFGLYKGNSET